MTLPSIPYIVGQIDPTAIASLISMGPVGFGSLAIAGCVWMYIQNQNLHARHVELLQTVIPVAEKLGDKVTSLESICVRLADVVTKLECRITIMESQSKQ
jgi:hypothetical protein